MDLKLEHQQVTFDLGGVKILDLFSLFLPSDVFFCSIFNNDAEPLYDICTLSLKKMLDPESIATTPEESWYLTSWFWQIKSSIEKLLVAVDPTFDPSKKTFECISIILKLARTFGYLAPKYAIMRESFDVWKDIGNEQIQGVIDSKHHFETISVYFLIRVKGKLMVKPARP